MIEITGHKYEAFNYTMTFACGWLNEDGVESDRFCFSTDRCNTEYSNEEYSL